MFSLQVEVQPSRMWMLGVPLQSFSLLLGPYPCTIAVVYCVAVLRKRSLKTIILPHLSHHVSSNKQKKEVEYEEVSVVVADGEHRSIELKSNAAYGPVQQLA